MKKDTIYTNDDNEAFTIEMLPSNGAGDQHLAFSICNGGSRFFLLSLSEVTEFCDLLKSAWVAKLKSYSKQSKTFDASESVRQSLRL
jgi:hypothetical protein